MVTDEVYSNGLLEPTGDPWFDKFVRDVEAGLDDCEDPYANH